jgi:hypothetical protein
VTELIQLEKARLMLAAKKGYRNWKSRFGEDFQAETRLGEISGKTLFHLARGDEKATFYLYDLIMGIKDLGSGFEFDCLNPGGKMLVIDMYLFLLDRMRFETMKRFGWLQYYPGEDLALVKLIADFEEIASDLQSHVPVLSPDHPGIEEYRAMNTLDREAFIRRLIPVALNRIKAQA